MELRETGKRGERRRFERFNIVFPILLAGWVPSILTLFISYTILSKTLESKILRDRQSVVKLIGHLVGDDLGRTGGARPPLVAVDRSGAGRARRPRRAHYMQAQVEAGHGCPITMTFAAVPSLRTTPALAPLWEPRITARVYDPRNVPDASKQGVTIGMAMTEKQGGSDVRANTTRAYPSAPKGRARHTSSSATSSSSRRRCATRSSCWRRRRGGLSCFLLPRWRPDGSKNPLQLLRLKRKMGNVSNASSETELRGALAWMVGDEGARRAHDHRDGRDDALRLHDRLVRRPARGAWRRRSTTARSASAFGACSTEQPLMQNVLADLALEHEGALALTMRIARAMDHRDDPHEDLLVRLVHARSASTGSASARRTHAYEAMECIGGSGVMEDSPIPRLFRESPVNAIWEGSGNVQCLDVLRAMQKTPAVVDAFFAELAKARGANAALDRCGRRASRRPRATARTSSTAPATWSTGWRWRSRRRCCCNTRRRTSPMRSARRASRPAATATTARCPAAWTARRSSSAPHPAPERGDAPGAPALGRRPPAICP